MTHQSDRTWKLGFISRLTVTGTIIVTSGNSVFAQSQIVPDKTLGSENSRVIRNADGLPVELIRGGARRGANLFHSFREFNVSEGRGAYFVNPAGVENIMSRVTGTNPSNILGTLGVLGNANLFLINPNGIIFGQNASLDVKGSFVATTADAIQFGQQGFFSASDPNSPPLLTVKPSAFLFNQIATQQPSITVNSRRLVGFDNSGNPVPVIEGLKVRDGQSLLLLGGNVNLNSGIIEAPGGRVELGGVTEVGKVRLNVEENNLRLSFPANLRRTDVSLTNGAVVNVTAGGGGSIAIAARNFALAKDSELRAGIGQGLGSINSQAGNIDINATETINIIDRSNINNLVQLGIGNAGNINIKTRSLSLSNQSALDTSSLGFGDAGNIHIQASESISVSGNSFMRAATLGLGDAGDISLEANRGTVSFDGARTEIDTSVRPIEGLTGNGKGGKVAIEARSLFLTDGAHIESETLGNGDAGKVRLTNENLVVRDGAYIFTGAGEESEGNAGQLTIEATKSVRVLGASFLSTSSFGKGDSGDLSIATKNLLSDEANITTFTGGQGDAGNLTVNAAESVQLIDTSSDGQIPSGLITSTLGTGNAGDLSVKTENLLVSNGATITTFTRGQGNAGNLTINAAESVQLIGTSSDGQIPSSLIAGTLGTGNAGDLSVKTENLLVSNGAIITTRTRGQGNAGNLTINAAESVQLIGTSSDGQIPSGLYTDAVNIGNAGDLSVKTENLLVSNGAIITTRTRGQGNAGGLSITTDYLLANEGASITTFTRGQGDAGNLTINAAESVRVLSDSLLATSTLGKGKAGNLLIKTGELLMSDGAAITTFTIGKGNAGNLTINAAESVQLIGTSSDGEISGSIATSAFRKGKAGNLLIKTGELLISDRARISTLTVGDGNAGKLTINATESVRVMDNSRLDSGTSGRGEAGELKITTGNLLVSAGSNILTFTNSERNAGKLTINAAESVRVMGNSRLRTSTLGKGDAGGLSITTDSLLVSEGAQLLTETRGTGNAGNVNINTRDRVSIDGTNSGAFSNVELGGLGEAGNINLETRSLSVTNNARVAVDSQGTKPGGNIDLKADSAVLERGIITAETASNTGGDIDLQIQDFLLLRNGSLISTTAGTAGAGGNGGDIDINSQFIIAVPVENSDISANAFEGRGGNVNITTQGIFGTQFREEPTNLSDITASSEFGSAGVVEIDAPDTDPSRRVVNLPTLTIEAEIVQACQPGDSQGQSEFIVTGRGGLPPSASEAIGTDPIGIDWVSLNPRTAEAENRDTLLAPRVEDNKSSERDRIIEAQGWVVGSDGKVILTAQAPTVTPHIPWLPNGYCKGS
ncbi:MAG: filamentous hemagglutinin N-terminal domain-containing protein [Hydrococcus sp. Prado102]|jgi:filamentous hemagglutinin family protein|nr:filamentous hemagglutinin N-terminal domain-containing protein [Hydrococcus sp. Prado102]